MDNQIKAVCYSIVGKVRKKNEDNFYFDNDYRKEEDELNLKCNLKEDDVVCIFDGMGGESKGDVASITASIVLKEYLDRRRRINWENYIELANEEVLKKSSNHEIVGTTIAGFSIDKNSIEICNVGDSKIFGLKNNKLIQISVDDNEEVMNKKLGINKKGALTQHLGLKDDEVVLSPHIKEFKIGEFNKILLCSDGLTDVLSKKEIEETINSYDIETCASKLIDRVLEEGAKDNTTIILVELNEEEIPVAKEIYVEEEKRSIFDIFRR